MEKVPISDGPHKKAGLVEESNHTSLFHLNEITDDFVVKVVNLIKGKRKMLHFESNERKKYSYHQHKTTSVILPLIEDESFANLHVQLTPPQFIYRKSGTFHCKHIFVVDGGYEN